MHVVVYVSTQTSRFTDQDLETLLRQSRRNNLVSEITGLLLYKDGNFMQILEGPKPNVHATLAKIKNDPRHCGLMLLLDEETPHREFKDWTMAFRKLVPETSREIPGYTDFLHLPLTSDQFSLNASTLLRFISIFQKSVS